MSTTQKKPFGRPREFDHVAALKFYETLRATGLAAEPAKMATATHFKTTYGALSSAVIRAAAKKRAAK